MVPTQRCQHACALRSAQLEQLCIGTSSCTPYEALVDAVICRRHVLPRALLAFVPAENMHLPYHPFALRGRHRRLLPTLVCVFTLGPLYALASAHINTLM